MTVKTAAPAASAAAKPKKPKLAKRPPPPKRHWLDADPPPPMKVCTVDDEEEMNPGLKGRLRQWIKRADAGDPRFDWLRAAVVRVGGSVYIDDIKFRYGLAMHTGQRPITAEDRKEFAAQAAATKPEA